MNEVEIVLADLDAFRSRCEEAEYTDTGEVWVMIDRLEAVLRQPSVESEALAQAWDEGWAARAEYEHRCDVPTNWPDLNPYRPIPPGPCPDTGMPVESCLCMTHDPDGAHFRTTRNLPPEGRVP